MMNEDALTKATNDLEDCLRGWRGDVDDARYNRDFFNQMNDFQGENKIILRKLKKLCQTGADIEYLETERGYGCIPRVFWSKDLIQFFVDKGANANSRDEEGCTALHLAIRHANYDEDETHFLDYFNAARQVIKYLLYDLNIDPNLPNLHGETALFAIAKYATGRVQHSSQKHLLEVAEMLFEKGADVTLLSKDGESVLHECKYGEVIVRFIEEFQRRGRDFVDVRTSSWLYSRTPLMKATRNLINDDWRTCCRVLIERGADVNATDLCGYTALHHAVYFRNHSCANFLVEMGADPSIKSATGKDSYDLTIRPSRACYRSEKRFNYSPTSPEKQVEILEISGATEILYLLLENDRKYAIAIELWEVAMDICKKFSLQPSQEFLSNYNFLKENRNNSGATEEIVLSATNTVARLSETTTTKFWNLMMTLSHCRGKMHQRSYIFARLDSLLQELKIIEDFASLEEIDVFSLSEVVEFFKDWLKELVKSGTSKNEATPERISQLHSIARLSIACLDKLKRETNSNKMSAFNSHRILCVTLFDVLTSLHVRFADVISATAFDENKGLLRKLINLDLRDGDDSSTLMHHVLGNCFLWRKDDFELFSALLDIFEFLDFKTRNLFGLEPVQMISCFNSRIIGKELFLKVLAKLADRGAHVDYVRNSSSTIIRDVFEKEKRWDLAFRYDTLQCACARVLAWSLVPFANRVPKHIVDFIRKH